MSRIRTLFMGTPDIAAFCLEGMLKDEHYEVVGVVTQPDRPAGRKLQLQPSPVKALAQPLGIPVFTPEQVSVPEVLAELENLKAEVVVVVAYGQILKQNFLDQYPGKVVNLHASLLPRWRGAAPIQRALMAGDKTTGVCLQVMVRKLDAGPILGARQIPLQPEMNAFDLYQQCQTQGVQLIAVDLMDYLRGNLTPTPQDESQVTYAKKIEKTEGLIDWSRSAVELHNLVRGLAMGPTAYTQRDGKTVKVHRTQVESHDTGPALRPGQVVSSSEKSLIVKCGQGTLGLLEVQPESRGKMSIAEYLRGHPVQAGENFGHIVATP